MASIVFLFPISPDLYFPGIYRSEKCYNFLFQFILGRRKVLGTFCTANSLDSIQGKFFLGLDSIPVKWLDEDTQSAPKETTDFSKGDYQREQCGHV